MSVQDLPEPKEAPQTKVLTDTQTQSSPSIWGWVIAASLAVLALLGAGGLSVTERGKERVALAAETGQLAVPTVAIVRPTPEPGADDLILPGTVQAYTESPIYARTTGYLIRWYKDIGASVTEGDLLADLDTPEVDQELSQANATRQQMVAALDLARTSAARWQLLRKSDSVTQQELDQKVSDYAQAQANLGAADANVHRLENLESFKHIHAPFSGVLTRRNVDIGALVNAGNGGVGNQLFNLARIDPLRVYVSVPEADAPAMHAGLGASLEFAEYPGKRFRGSVVRTSDAIDLNTRTLLTEVDVPNPDGRLLPGSYTQVHFRVGISTRRLSIPSSAMLFREEGPRIAVVGPDDKVRLHPIVIGRDFGITLEILQGIGPSDRVVLNPPDSLEDGETVHVNEGSAKGKQS